MTNLASPLPAITAPAQRFRPQIALAALIGAGLLLGVSTNLAKIAHGTGVAPLAYLSWSLAGAALLLTLLRGRCCWRPATSIARVAGPPGPVQSPSLYRARR